MKKLFKPLFAALLILAVLLSCASCYMVSGQKMDTVKGTYKLTRYTVIPSYERRNGYTPSTIDYLTDERYLYEDYLVVTGSGSGYYVRRDASGVAYSKEITLSYEYDSENSSHVEYVIYNDALSVNSTMGIHKLGVTKNSLNYTKGGFDYTELITNRPMRSEDISVRWEKVDRATDLSYAKSVLGALKEYSYEAFGARGIYELTAPIDTETGDVLDFDYRYFFYVIDTASGVTTATVCYALNDTPTERVTETVTFSHGSDGFNTFVIDGVEWTADSLWQNYYYREADGAKYTIHPVYGDISESALDYMVESRVPIEE